MNEKQIKVITTLGKVAGLATAASSYINMLPPKYIWVGSAIVLVSSVAKDVLAFLNGIWDNTPTGSATASKASLVALLFCLCVFPASAQDVAPTPLVTPRMEAATALPISTNTIPEQAQQIVLDAYNSLSSVSFAHGAEVAVGYINIGGNSGGFIAIDTPATNGVSVGFFVADIRESGKNTFYDGGLNIALQGDVTVPILGFKVHSKLATGPVIDISHANAVYNQTTMIFNKTWTLNKHVYLSLFGGAAYVSKWDRPGYLAGLNSGFTW